MKDSDYAMLLANIYLAQFVGKGWCIASWLIYMIAFGVLKYAGE
jgi:hypothetical protein